MKVIIKNHELTLIPENKDEAAKIEQYRGLANVFGDDFIIESIKTTYAYLEGIEKVKDITLQLIS